MSVSEAGLHIPDPRPSVVDGAQGAALSGWRCASCAYPLALLAPWCPRCRGALEATVFARSGAVWSSTMLTIAFQGRTPPIVLAYVDIDEGPRILAHVSEAAERLKVGRRVQVAGVSEDGDVLVAVIEEKED